MESICIALPIQCHPLYTSNRPVQSGYCGPIIITEIPHYLDEIQIYAWINRMWSRIDRWALIIIRFCTESTRRYSNVTIASISKCNHYSCHTRSKQCVRLCVLCVTCHFQFYNYINPDTEAAAAIRRWILSVSRSLNHQRFCCCCRLLLHPNQIEFNVQLSFSIIITIN